jgi:hypothetical protein
MKIAKNKTVTISIAMFLMLSMATSLILLPCAIGHSPAWQFPTYAYIWATPNPDGVGQTVSVFMWLTNYYYGAGTGALGVANNLRFHNFKLTITAPNGEVTTQTFATIIDTTSNQHTSFIPDQVGTYNLTFTYPGETYTSTDYISDGLFGPPGPNPYTNDTFLPSSASTTVTVQQASLPNALTGAPLPTAYWTRPIYGENTNWYSISSNWLGIYSPNYGGWSNTAGNTYTSGDAMFPGDAVGSQTNHVMWTKALQSGGVVGGNNVPTGDTYFDGSAYLIRYNNPIILDGKLYYTEPIGFSNSGFSFGPGGSGYGPTDCVDLRTGQTIWSRTDVPVLFFGYIQSIDTVNEHGVTPPILVSISTDFLSGATTWMLYDGDTGNALGNVTNVPSSAGDPSRVMGPFGNYVSYVFANAGTTSKPNWRVAEWNSSLVFLPLGAGAPTFTGTINGGSPNTYDWNVSVPYLNTQDRKSVV